MRWILWVAALMVSFIGNPASANGIYAYLEDATLTCTLEVVHADGDLVHRLVFQRNASRSEVVVTLSLNVDSQGIDLQPEIYDPSGDLGLIVLGRQPAGVHFSFITTNLIGDFAWSGDLTMNYLGYIRSFEGDNVGWGVFARSLDGNRNLTDRLMTHKEGDETPATWAYWSTNLILADEVVFRPRETPEFSVRFDLIRAESSVQDFEACITHRFDD